MPKTSDLLAATLPLAGTELLYLSDEGVDRKLTVADLIAAAVAAAAPAPVVKLWRFASAMSNKSGSGAKSPIAEVDVIRLDASGPEAVGETISPLPADWVTVKTTLQWANVTADAGNVVWRLDAGFPGADGTGIAGVVTLAAPIVTAAALGQSVFVQTVLDIDLANVPGRPLTYTITRVAGDAADTKVGDAAVFAVIFEKVA